MGFHATFASEMVIPPTMVTRFDWQGHLRNLIRDLLWLSSILNLVLKLLLEVSFTTSIYCPPPPDGVEAAPEHGSGRRPLCCVPTTKKVFSTSNAATFMIKRNGFGHTVSLHSQIISAFPPH